MTKNHLAQQDHVPCSEVFEDPIFHCVWNTCQLQVFQCFCFSKIMANRHRKNSTTAALALGSDPILYLCSFTLFQLMFVFFLSKTLLGEWSLMFRWNPWNFSTLTTCTWGMVNFPWPAGGFGCHTWMADHHCVAHLLLCPLNPGRVFGCPKAAQLKVFFVKETFVEIEWNGKKLVYGIWYILYNVNYPNSKLHLWMILQDIL